jgi:CubicO group peptidase (beta-lactamase class C family)
MDATTWDKSTYCTNLDVINIIIREKPPRSYPPNTHFEYSNTNYILLAAIIEKISGLSYPAYMKKYFFEPLHMDDSYVFTKQVDSSKLIYSYTESGRRWDFDYLDLTYGDKNIYSTPQDLLKWDQALYTNQVLSDSMLQRAFTPYSNEKKSYHNYGLGWRLIQPPGTNQNIVYHFGRWHGFNAAFARIPSQKATIIIIGNRFSRAIYNTAHLAYPLFDITQSDENKEDE